MFHFRYRAHLVRDRLALRDSWRYCQGMPNFRFVCQKCVYETVNQTSRYMFT